MREDRGRIESHCESQIETERRSSRVTFEDFVDPVRGGLVCESSLLRMRNIISSNSQSELLRSSNSVRNEFESVISLPLESCPDVLP